MFKRFLHSADQQLDFTSVKAQAALHSGISHQRCLPFGFM
jgi:hypothetical protein